MTPKIVKSYEQWFFIKMMKFFIVSCAGLFINTLTFVLMLDSVPDVIPIYPLLLDFTLPTRLWEFVSVSTAILVTTLWNFILNKLWTFRLQAENKDFALQTTQYMIVGAIGAVENLGIYVILTTFFYLESVSSEIIAFIVSVLSNFLLNNYWTFTEKEKDH